MADLKISQLSDGGASQATDEYVVARSGSNFRIDGASVAAAATSVGTLTSLTVSGDLTVDTSTLKVDSANNRVGIGTASPAVRLDVAGDVTVAGDGSTTFSTINLIRKQVLSAGAGVGLLNFQGYSTGTTVQTGAQIVGDIPATWTSTSTPANLLFYTTPSGSTTPLNRLTLDASGNLGLGVTPSAWSSAFGPVVQIKTGSGGGALTGSSTDNFRMFANTFYDGAYKRIGAGYATQYEQAAGAHAWYTAGTSTANSSISYTQAMTLDASGNLGVGTTSPATRLDVAQTNAKSATAVWQIQTFDTTSATTGVGGGISFGGYKTSNTAAEVFAAIDGYKENATGGNAAGALRFHTQVSGGTGVVERARITSGGDVQIRTADAYLYSNGTSGGTTIDAGFRLLSSSKVLSFWTNDAERARITSGGYFKASNDSTYFSSAGAQHELRSNSSSATTFILSNPASSYAADMMYINVGNSSGTGFNFISADTSAGGQFKVRGDGTIYAQNTTVQSISDARLKENISDATDGLSVITALRPVRYDWKAGYGNDRKNQLGFIAQEVEAVFPEAVSEWVMDEPTGEVDEDGKPITEKVDYKTVGPGALIPVLVKAIQELEARIATLEAGA